MGRSQPGLPPSPPPPPPPLGDQEQVSKVPVVWGEEERGRGLEVEEGGGHSDLFL